MSEDALVLLTYVGFDALVRFPDWVAWAHLSATILILVSIMIYGNRVRIVALYFFPASIFLLVLPSGLNIESGLSMMIRDSYGLLVGALLACLYFTDSGADTNSSATQ